MSKLGRQSVMRTADSYSWRVRNRATNDSLVLLSDNLFIFLEQSQCLHERSQSGRARPTIVNSWLLIMEKYGSRSARRSTA